MCRIEIQLTVFQKIMFFYLKSGVIAIISKILLTLLHYYKIIIMQTGKVKFFNVSKGFGFIVADDTNQDIFVHQTGLIHEVRENDRVSFEVKEGKKGLNAINVEKI
jgi:cold shock protein